jgi:hypothetical protein
MDSLTSILTVAHIIGLSLAVGAATVKLVLLVKSNSDTELLQVYIKIVRPITKVLITGMILVTLSGIGWLLSGYPLISSLIVKIILVAAVWILGPIIDNVVEPKFRLLAAETGQTDSPDFILIRKKYLALEIIATSIFYIVIFYWILA